MTFNIAKITQDLRENISIFVSANGMLGNNWLMNMA